MGYLVLKNFFAFLLLFRLSPMINGFLITNSTKIGCSSWQGTHHDAQILKINLTFLNIRIQNFLPFNVLFLDGIFSNSNFEYKSDF